MRRPAPQKNGPDHSDHTAPILTFFHPKLHQRAHIRAHSPLPPCFPPAAPHPAHMHAAPASTTPLNGSDQPSGCPAIPVLLAEFFCPQAVTLPHILASHNISPEQLLAWIKDPRNQSTIAAIHELNNLRRDFAISHARTDSLGILLGIQERFRKQMETTSDGFGVSDRLTESARKASLHLLAVTGDLKSPPPRSRVLQDPRGGGADDKATHAGWQEGAAARASDRGSARSLSDDPTANPPPPAQRVRARSGRGQGRAAGFAPSPTPSMPFPAPNSHADSPPPPAQQPARASDRGSAQSPSDDPTRAPQPEAPTKVPASDRDSARALPNDHAPETSPPTSAELFARVEALLSARAQRTPPAHPSGP